MSGRKPAWDRGADPPVPAPAPAAVPSRTARSSARTGTGMRLTLGHPSRSVPAGQPAPAWLPARPAPAWLRAGRRVGGAGPAWELRAGRRVGGAGPAWERGSGDVEEQAGGGGVGDQPAG